MSERDYATGFEKVAHDFNAYAVKLQNQETPPRAGMSKDQHRMAVIAQVRQTSDGFQAIANEESALKPPERFQALHQDAMRLYQDQADLWHQWADAMVRRDQVAINSISDRIDTLGQQDSTNLRFHAEAAFAGDPRYRNVIAEFEQRNPIPGRPTLGPASEKGYAMAWCELAFRFYDMAQKSRVGVPKPGPTTTEEAFDKALEAGSREFGQSIRKIAKDERLLQPPGALVALHLDTLTFYDAQAALADAFAAAIAKGQPSARKAVVERIEATSKLQLIKIRADVRAVAPSDKTMETAVEAMERVYGIHHSDTTVPAK